MELFFIRHGKTWGNLQHRYIGVTNEPLCPQGREELQNLATAGCYPPAQAVYSSPMERCVETAALLFPNQPLQTVEGLREINFGLWENKNWQELSGDVQYQSWVDSGGALPFPQGEGQVDFCRRCCEAWESCVNQLFAQNTPSAAFVVHGGTIMAVLSRYTNQRDYFYWQAENGCGFVVQLTKKKWESCQKVTVTAAIGRMAHHGLPLWQIHKTGEEPRSPAGK